MLLKTSSRQNMQQFLNLPTYYNFYLCLKHIGYWNHFLCVLDFKPCQAAPPAPLLILSSQKSDWKNLGSRQWTRFITIIFFTTCVVCSKSFSSTTHKANFFPIRLLHGELVINRWDSSRRSRKEQCHNLEILLTYNQQNLLMVREERHVLW